MKKLLFSAILFINIGKSTAQKDDAKHFASFITSDELKKHLTILAGDEMQGRETGTEGQRKAADYIETQFRLLGLKAPESLKGYQQLYPLYRDSMISSKLEIGTKPAVPGKDFILPVNNNETGKFSGKTIVFAGYGIEDKNYSDYELLDVKNKIVLMFLGEPKANENYLVSGNGKSGDWTYPGLSKKLQLAAEKGAAGALIINPAMESFTQDFIDRSVKTSVYFPRNNGNKLLNYALLSHDFSKTVMGDQIDSLIKKARASMPFDKSFHLKNNINVSYDYQKYRTTINASNVIGVIEGTDKKDEYIYLTAHYDHLGVRNGKIYYGADDDGSGTAGVIQMAAAFAKAKAAGKGSRRTIVFMTFSGEEKGLWGSEYYSENPVYPLDKASVDLNTDMVGRIDTERETADTMNYVYVVGHDKLSTDLPVINEAINKKYTNLTLDYKFDDPEDPQRIYFRSDHYNFARKGVPVLFFYDGMLKADYHKPTDTVDKITWPLYETRMRMIFHLAWEMANRDEMLKRNIELPAETR